MDGGAGRWRIAEQSLVLNPLMWLLAIAAWLVPMTSSKAAGHHLYVVLIFHWPFLLLLAALSAVTPFLARRRRRHRGSNRDLVVVLGVLQFAQLGAFITGCVPILVFDLAPEASIEVGSTIHILLAPLVLGAILVGWILLRDVPSHGQVARTASFGGSPR